MNEQKKQGVESDTEEDTIFGDAIADARHDGANLDGVLTRFAIAFGLNLMGEDEIPLVSPGTDSPDGAWRVAYISGMSVGLSHAEASEYANEAMRLLSRKVRGVRRTSVL